MLSAFHSVAHVSASLETGRTHLSPVTGLIAVYAPGVSAYVTADCTHMVQGQRAGLMGSLRKNSVLMLYYWGVSQALYSSQWP